MRDGLRELRCQRMIEALRPPWRRSVSTREALPFESGAIAVPHGLQHGRECVRIRVGECDQLVHEREQRQALKGAPVARAGAQHKAKVGELARQQRQGRQSPQAWKVGLEEAHEATRAKKLDQRLRNHYETVIEHMQSQLDAALKLNDDADKQWMEDVEARNRQQVATMQAYEEKCRRLYQTRLTEYIERTGEWGHATWWGARRARYLHDSATREPMIPSCTRSGSRRSLGRGGSRRP